MYVTAAMMWTQLAMAAPAPSAEAAAPTAPVVAPDWAAPARPIAADKALIRRAIKQSFDEEEAIALAKSKEAAIPQRYSVSSEPDRDNFEKFEIAFEDAKVPGCLRSDGLKRQSTFIFGQLLALPFIAVAAVRGKCN
jgi:hypothetical protein